MLTLIFFLAAFGLISIIYFFIQWISGGKATFSRGEQNEGYNPDSPHSLLFNPILDELRKKKDDF